MLWAQQTNLKPKWLEIMKSRVTLVMEQLGLVLAIEIFDEFEFRLRHCYFCHNQCHKRKNKVCKFQAQLELGR